MSRPSGEIDVASQAASTDDVRFKGNRQSKDGIYDLQWVDLLRYKSWKPRIQLRDEIGPDLAVRVVFTEVFWRTIRIDAVAAIRTDQGHEFEVDDIWCAPEKIIVDNRLLIGKNARFMHVHRSWHWSQFGSMIRNSRWSMILTSSRCRRMAMFLSPQG
jgi:hypothetical protein